MLSKAFDTKQTTQIFLVNILKKSLKKIDDLTVFEPKHSLECLRRNRRDTSEPNGNN